MGSWRALPSSRADQRVQPPSQSVVGDAHRGAQAAEPRRRRVEQLARPGRSCAPSVRRTAGSGCSSRPSSRRSGRRSSARDVARRAVASSVSAISRNCCGIQPAAARRALDGRPDVVGARRSPTPGRSDEERRGPGRSRRGRARRRPGRRTARGPRPGGATAGTRSRRPAARGRAGTRGAAASARPSPRPASGRQRPGARPDSDGWPATTNRHGTDCATARRRSAIADPGRRVRRRPVSSAGRGSSRSGEAGSHRSVPVHASVDARRPRRRGPGPLARRWSGEAASARPAASRPGLRASGAGDASHGEPGGAHAPRRRRAARRRGSAPRPAALRLGDDVEAVIHPVDKVHVGDARPART